MLKYVLIDIDDTIFDFHKCAEWSMKRSAEEMGIKIPDDALELFLEVNTMLWKDLEKKILTPEELYDRRFKLVFDRWGTEGDTHLFEKKFEGWLKESTIMMDGADRAVKYLSSKYDVYTASNGLYESQVKRLTKAGLIGYIKDNFISHKIGIQKPNFGFFDYCYKKIGCASKDEIVMIGDALSSDMYGAANYGIGYYWYNWRHEKCPGDLHPLGEFYELKELEKLI